MKLAAGGKTAILEMFDFNTKGRDFLLDVGGK